jgi:hypothetical protein
MEESRGTGRESVGATLQLDGKFGAGRSGGIPKARLLSYFGTCLTVTWLSRRRPDHKI